MAKEGRLACLGKGYGWNSKGDGQQSVIKKGRGAKDGRLVGLSEGYSWQSKRSC